MLWDWIKKNYARTRDHLLINQRAHGEAINTEDMIKQHAELSRIIRNVTLTILGYSFFCLITIAGPDTGLILGEIKIPFANVNISPFSFLVVGPLILVALSFYLHVFIEKWSMLGDLEESKRLPYVFNIDGPVARLISYSLFYLLTPIVMIAFVWKSSPLRHQITSQLFKMHILAYVSQLMSLLSFGVLLIFFFLFIRQVHSRGKQSLIFWFFGCIFVSLMILSGLYSYQRLAPVSGLSFLLREYDLNRADLRGKYLRGAILQNARMFSADLRDSDLSEGNLNGAILCEADLSGAEMIKAYLIEADLRMANLEGVNLAHAELREADLRMARLRKACLYDARLLRANLKWTNFMEADLRKAYLENADLGSASLKKADLSGAKLAGADLLLTDFLESKGLKPDQLRQAKNWQNAVYSDDVSQKLGISPQDDEEIRERLNLPPARWNIDFVP